MSNIKDISAMEILDSRGIPALQVKILLDDNTVAHASSATNTFPSEFAAVDMRDNDLKRYFGYGTLQTITILNKFIKPYLIGLDCYNQQNIDKTLINLDGTPQKSKLGGNTITAISMAVCKAAAKSKQIPLYHYLAQIYSNQQLTFPIPIFTMIDGGKNANFNTDIQEFLIIPASNKSLPESLELAVSVYKTISQILLKENILPFIGEKGGLGPLLSTNEDALALISQAFDTLNIRLGYDAYIGLDINANAFYKDKHYKIKDHSSALSGSELIKLYSDFSQKFHILYLEDPLSNDDLDGWNELYSTLNNKLTISGDYFTATNPNRLQVALEKQTINGIVIKPANIGTITESLAVSNMAHATGLKITVSDRTAETNDTFLADFAVAISADYAHFGAPVKGERVAKYNRLLEINNEIK
jgi:enolase